MNINLDKYVVITSGVGGGDTVNRRELILRMFSTSTKVSPTSILEFPDAASVGAYFGIDSEEYRAAVRYFAYISPNITRPRKISVARDQSAPSPATVVGRQIPQSIDLVKSAAGAVAFSVNGVEFATGQLSFAQVLTFADASAILQTALRGVPGVPPSISTCVVSFSAVDGRFYVTAGANSAETIKFAADFGGVADTFGLSGGATNVTGVEKAVEPQVSVAVADDVSNNYGTFIFLRSLALPQILAVAQYNAEKNVQFEYVIGVTRAVADTVSAALLSTPSVSLTLVGDKNIEHDEVASAAFKAATDYSQPNSVISYMYRRMPGLSAKVDRTAESNDLDTLRVNYYGQTQTAGTSRLFYQRGVMMGDASAPVDQNTHANEQWLKDDISAGFLELLLNLGRVSANTMGANKISNVIATTVNRAVSNGTISVGKPLSDLQKVYIAEQSSDVNAPIQVQNIGYWYGVSMQPYATADGRTEWKAVYTLIYSKDDTIRKVEGRHILI